MTETQELIKSLANQYGRKRESLLPVLQGIVEKNRYLTDDATTEIAKELDISASLVYGVASFYSFLYIEPKGKFIIRVCKTITCDMKGKSEIIRTIEDMLKIKIGETTHDKMFSLIDANCLGWCHQGPAILINDEPYTNLTPNKIREIIGTIIRNNK